MSTVLHTKIIQYNLKIVALLIKNGVIIDIKDKKGKTPRDYYNLEFKGTELHWQVLLGNLSKVKDLVEKGADICALDNPQDIDIPKRNPIQYAVASGNKEILKYFLTKNVSIEKYFLLHFAALDGQKEIAEYLIQKGADMNQKDKGWGIPAFVPAIIKGESEILRFFIRKGMNVNYATEDGEKNSLLHLAVAFSKNNPTRKSTTENLRCIELLIKNGAEINAVNNSFVKVTPLDIAENIKDERVIQLLKKYGAKKSQNMGPK